MSAPWENDPTPSVEEYLAEEERDPNLWWRIACGHHQNLFEEAVERMQEQEQKIRKLYESAYTLRGTPTVGIHPDDIIDILDGKR